jgi:hypothetical protein
MRSPAEPVPLARLSNVNPTPTFMTDTMGSVSSLRMPTTDMLCGAAPRQQGAVFRLQRHVSHQSGGMRHGGGPWIPGSIEWMGVQPLLAKLQASLSTQLYMTL